MSKPPYILCPQCERVPVSRIGELCETCQKLADAAQARADAELERLEEKPHSWRDMFRVGR